MITPNAHSSVDEPLDLGPLPDLVGYALRRAQLVVFADFYERFAAVDLRPGQFAVLLLLRHNPGVRPSRVADALGIKRANFAPLLAALQARNLVTRTADAADRRAHALHLTADGTTLLQRADQAQAAHETAWLQRLGPRDHAALMRILHRMA